MMREESGRTTGGAVRRAILGAGAAALAIVAAAPHW